MTLLEDEKDYLARCETALRRMLDGARLNVVVGERVAGDRYSAERLGRHLKSLAKELAEEPDGPPFFGRLDFGSGPAAGDHRAQRYYIGRRHISGDAGQQPMVIDWRAPVSRAFYRAGARDPQGVAVRRRFGWAGRTLTGFEDERLDRGEDLGAASRIVTAEIERPRVGPMRDIVATIQPEQDELVRAGLEDSICVQGAPGTGKTAVGLHRAAYLLYAHRQRLERGGVLVLGPNHAFLGYISAVLPALGEVDVEQTTMERLLAHAPIRQVDGEAAATVKHDARMADVLRRALYGRVRRPAEPLTVPDGSYRWRVPQEDLRRIVDDTRREAPPYAVGRERVLSRTVAALRRQAEARGQTTGAAWTRKMGRAVTPFLDAVWPAVRPHEVVAELLGDPAALARAADGTLTPREQAAITWARPPRTFKSARWSTADTVLIDEVAGLLERPRSYGHVIVDEAQDLSAMQCRAVARRSEHGSITVLGDLAQGTTPWAARDWRERLAHLGKPEAQVIALTTGFRVPSDVVALANRLLGALKVDVPPTRSFRTDGRLRVEEVSDLPHATVAAVRDALRHDGSIAVVAADAAVERLAAALWNAGVTIAEAGETGGGARVTVVPATMAKGLEYDHVVVAEPAEIVGAEERGLNRLYVVLTRAVSRLDVLHRRPLPPQLTGA
ncbi:HelD family protein [Streptosporangium roseum]|uniref:Superfamily I DNA and RNA helicase-like protein n=1 Tax=Streptosporangium roseum (strain ATCC 12428 / DSM 43021 / JCM 3005 / KCTC 9067 / NCIMB 10171 / NRRL 2505 / NI 9100) TaxID=479432 RepID=D2AWK4_STRRD|nr:AAA family ATPase [Streptosporangium roseum]ACZ87000.1 Superfamily I DNA and RNA helicase-like protein [Streptosporangium roseum DSM 43021]